MNQMLSILLPLAKETLNQYDFDVNLNLNLNVK